MIAGAYFWETLAIFTARYSFWERLGIYHLALGGVSLLLLLVAAKDGFLKRALSHPWLCWLGFVSYEWYLLHQIIILYIRELLGSAEGSFLKYGVNLGAGVVVSLLLAAVTYHFISVPLMKWGRRD